MKKLFGLLVFTACALVASNASAVTIAAVQSLDTYIASTDLGDSGDAAEMEWIAEALSDYLDTTILAEDLDYAKVLDSEGDGDFWLEVTGEPGEADDPDTQDWWAFDFQEADVDPYPQYFLVKLGGGNVDDTHYLYENEEAFRYGVVDLLDLGDGQSIEIGKISHVSTVGEVGGEIPEPASLILLGTGLIGAAAGRRRRKAAKK